VANYDTFITVTLTDANGDTARMRVSNGITADTATLASLAGASGVSGFLTALGAPGTITNAKVTSVVVSFLYEKAGPAGAVDAEFASVTDGARMNFLNSLGGRGIVTVPAPIAAVFGATPNEDTVDPAGPIAALITWLEAHNYDGANLLNVYNGGMKVGRNARRRAQHKVA